MNPASSSSTAGGHSFDFVPASSRELPEQADHLQRLAQMTQGVGVLKREDLVGMSESGSAADSALYGAAAYYGSWPHQYYQQFAAASQPINPPFGGWPGAYATPHWPNYASSSKKGRQTYQRYQTGILENKFQLSSYVSKKQREELRMQTGLTDRQIKIWFQHKKEKIRVDEQGTEALLPAHPPKSTTQPTGGDNVELTTHHHELDKWAPPVWPAHHYTPYPPSLCSQHPPM